MTIIGAVASYDNLRRSQRPKWRRFNDARCKSVLLPVARHVVPFFQILVAHLYEVAFGLWIECDRGLRVVALRQLEEFMDSADRAFREHG